MHTAMLPASSRHGSVCKQARSYTFTICEVLLHSQPTYTCRTISCRQPQSHLARAMAQGMETGRPVVARGETVLHQENTVTPPAPAQSQDGVSGCPEAAAEAITEGYSTLEQRRSLQSRVTRWQLRLRVMCAIQQLTQSSPAQTWLYWEPDPKRGPHPTSHHQPG